MLSNGMSLILGFYYFFLSCICSFSKCKILDFNIDRLGYIKKLRINKCVTVYIMSTLRFSMSMLQVLAEIIRTFEALSSE